MVKIKSSKKIKDFAKHLGFLRYEHEKDILTLKRLILVACFFSLILVSISSWMFYSDPRSKYDLVRPGRRELPESFRVEETNKDEKTKEDVKSDLQELNSKLEGLDIYGEFNDNSLNDDKVLQNYLDQQVIEQ